MSNQTQLASRPRTQGEIWVWLCGMGLATCICMILGLLVLIFSQGLAVFWPANPVSIRYVDSQGVTQEVAGVPGRPSQPPPVQFGMDSPSAVPEDEWRIFIGSRDFYEESFLNLTDSQIQATESRQDLWVGEQIQSGTTFFIPQKLHFGGDNSLSAESSEFKRVLQEELEEINSRRLRIRQLERGKIGKINRKLDRLSSRERSLQAELNLEADKREQRLEAIAQERDTLQAAYEVFQSEVRSLRNLQKQVSLQYRILGGPERMLSLDQFLTLYHPSALSLWGKMGHYFDSLWRFLSQPPREANTLGGIFPAIFGTFVMTVLMSAAVVPFGVLAAVYLREYASQGPLVGLVRISVLNLAGVPSIVFGVFGLGFFIYFVGGGIDALFFSDRLPTATFGTGGIFWASLTLAIMTVPVVIVATEEALGSVPQGMREASLACGASKWQTTYRVVLPASIPGILTGLILAMARGAGEVAPLMLVGVVKLAPSLPIDGQFPFVHLDRKFMHLGFHIYDLGFQSPNAEATLPLLYATAVFLILLILSLNLGAILLRNHLRKKYVSGTF